VTFLKPVVAALALVCALSFTPTLNAERSPNLVPKSGIVIADYVAFTDWCWSYCYVDLTISENYALWVAEGKPTP
jgi:hypothetical protein